MAKQAMDEGRRTKDEGQATNGQAQSSAVNRQSSASRQPSAASRQSASRVVVPKATRYEQRAAVPKMRTRMGRQRSLRVESKPISAPFRLPTLPRLDLRWREMTPARASSLVLAATCVALIAFFFGADGFYVYSADIKGNRLVSAQDIYARSGLDGVNIFLAKPAQAEERIRDVPFVKNARVSLQLPARVRIDVEERAPAALWQVAGNTYGIAEDGTILPPDGAAPSVPVIQAEGAPLQFGGKIEGDAVVVAQKLRTLIPDAQRIIASTERGVGIVTAQGWPVYFGSEDDDIAARVAILNGLVTELKEEKVEPEFIDLRSGSRPYYRLKTAR